MHKNNKHSKDYNFKELIANFPQLAEFVFESKYAKNTIDFANPKAVKYLNSALLKTHYGIDYWKFPDENLCPPIPGRVEYVHLLNDLLKASGLKKDITVFDIGTGATCIYPLLGHKEYNWNFIASEIDKKALENAKLIVEKNSLSKHIELRFQDDPQSILNGVLLPSEHISAVLCNPPFYKNEAEANENTLLKQKGLGKQTDKVARNFSGTAKELWYPGGEKAFVHNYLYQSSLLKTNCFWYTCLVSKTQHVLSMEASLKKLGVTDFKILQLSLGNKISRVVAWTFLTEDEQKEWTS
ncbi:23S rRNA (adenine(1618)-N(6))-methyltransferase RlmF [Psychroserpens ponticola]|uniref:23S rRNA (Adenine(1618)-N(6))-methyltransferase RlmF n=1 Tax=Psychroserpens ponticola TaxID=2932268 RepID=A0ABY7S0L6_9FLAO|nr:23S rRNA (adenine(1618)-N(6))-methyltransferase RlmF [Psychroserpens ponticola]WCO02838.1 23S rRNA (adenine(1618)-N(6))-methyltransferase RlmF [Psychroserpens ponticola]